MIIVAKIQDYSVFPTLTYRNEVDIFVVHVDKHFRKQEELLHTTNNHISKSPTVQLPWILPSFLIDKMRNNSAISLYSILKKNCGSIKIKCLKSGSNYKHQLLDEHSGFKSTIFNFKSIYSPAHLTYNVCFKLISRLSYCLNSIETKENIFDTNGL